MGTVDGRKGGGAGEAAGVPEGAGEVETPPQGGPYGGAPRGVAGGESKTGAGSVRRSYVSIVGGGGGTGGQVGEGGATYGD